MTARTTALRPKLARAGCVITAPQIPVRSRGACLLVALVWFVARRGSPPCIQRRRMPAASQWVGHLRQGAEARIRLAMGRSQLCGKSKARAGSDETGVQKCLNALDNAAAMDAGNLGVTKHHSEVLLSNFVPAAGQAPSTDYKRLRHHLLLFSYAEALHSSRIKSLGNFELLEALNKFAVVTSIASNVLVCACVNQRCFQKELLAPRAEDNINRLFDLAWVWGDIEGEARFDIHRPVLSGIQTDIGAKRAHMKELLFSLFMGQALMDTTAVVIKVAPLVVAELAARTEAVAAKEDITEEESGAVCELSTCSNGFACLMDVQQVFTNPRSDVLLADLKALRSTNDNGTEFLTAVALTVADVPRLSAIVTKALENESAILELKLVAEELVQGLDATEAGAPLTDRCLALLDALRACPRFACALPAEFTTFLRDRFRGGAAALISCLPEAGDGNTYHDRQALGVLSAAVQAFPGDESLVAFKQSAGRTASQRKRQWT